MAFDSLGLTPALLRAVGDMGLYAPTPIQAEAIPAVLKSADVWATAPTGSGKTLAFALPLLQHLLAAPRQTNFRRPVRTLVLVPTRELAVQVGEVLANLAYKLPQSLKVNTVFGGVSINPQMMALRGGADIVVATPGRLLDLIDQNALRLADVQHLVLDEADRLLDLGFAEELQRCCLPSAKRCCSRPRLRPRWKRWPPSCCASRFASRWKPLKATNPTSPSAPLPLTRKAAPPCCAT
jgi:superfamily II DNA/RNA helicase